MSPAVTHQTVYAARLNFITTPSRQETRNGTSPYVTRLPVTRTNAQLNFQLSKALPVTHQGMRRPLLVERENKYVDKYNRFVFFIIPFTIVTIATIVNPHVYEMKYLLFKNISGWRVVWNQCTFFIYKNKSILHSRQTRFIEIRLLFLYLQSFVSSFSLYYFQVFALESKSVRHGAINHKWTTSLVVTQGVSPACWTGDLASTSWGPSNKTNQDEVQLWCKIMICVSSSVICTSTPDTVKTETLFYMHFFLYVNYAWHLFFWLD